MITAKENLEMFKEFGTTGYETLRTLTDLNVRTYEKLVEKQAETFNLFVDAGIELVKLSSEAKDPKAFIESEVELAKQLSENLVAKSRESLEVAAEVRDEYKSFAEANVEAFTAKVSEAAQKAA
jgi:phasin family protein